MVLARATRFAGLACAAFLGGCAVGLLYPAPTPIPIAVHYANPARASRCLVVFLPGVRDDPGTVSEQGLLDALAAHGLAVDVVSVGNTFGYDARHDVVTRLREDVLARMAPRRYEQIWLVGVSLGAQGALLLAREPYARIAGVLLLSPYLGQLDDMALLRQIARSGGLTRWDGAHTADETDEADVWRFLKEVALHPEGPPVVYLGIGDDDPFGHGEQLLADALPADRVFRAPGGHEWSTWANLWSTFLDDSDFRTRCEGSP
jgi:pimeloyl-ACP methyl ester carboxylesterase